MRSFQSDQFMRSVQSDKFMRSVQSDQFMRSVQSAKFISSVQNTDQFKGSVQSAQFMMSVQPLLSAVWSKVTRSQHFAASSLVKGHAVTADCREQSGQRS